MAVSQQGPLVVDATAKTLTVTYADGSNPIVFYAGQTPAFNSTTNTLTVTNPDNTKIVFVAVGTKFVTDISLATASNTLTVTYNDGSTKNLLLSTLATFK